MLHSLTSSSYIICLWGETFGSRTILFHFSLFWDFSLEINIFGLKTFRKVYIENSKDIYGGRRVKLAHVKRKCQMHWSEESACSNFIKIWKKIWSTDPTLHRACEGNQTISYLFGLSVTCEGSSITCRVRNMWQISLVQAWSERRFDGKWQIKLDMT